MARRFQHVKVWSDITAATAAALQTLLFMYPQLGWAGLYDKVETPRVVFFDIFGCALSLWIPTAGLPANPFSLVSL